MKRWIVKPFTFFLLCLVLLFLIFAPPFLSGGLKKPKDLDLFELKKQEWTGVITLWDIPYVQTGKGNAASWLGKYISRFEKQYPGVFIDVRPLTTERLAMYLHGEDFKDVMPDMISLGIYEKAVPEDLLLDLSPYFRSDELERMHPLALACVQSGAKITGVPWMMGSYGLIINQNVFSDMDPAGIPESMNYDILDQLARKMSYQKKSGRKTIGYFGFCTYANSSSRPLLSMIYGEDGKIVDNAGYNLFQSWKQDSGIFPPEMGSFSYARAFRMLTSDKRAAMMLGSSRVIFDNRNLLQAGKGIDFRVFAVPAVSGGQYQDQIASYGILKGDSEEKRKLCILFLKGLLEQEAQSQLADLGMFSVLKDLSLYAEDAEMNVLEQALKQAGESPFGQDRAQVNSLWEKLLDAGY